MLIAMLADLLGNAKTTQLTEDVAPLLREHNLLPDDFSTDDHAGEDLAHAVREHASDEQILTFDCECIEDSDDYANLFHIFVERAGVGSQVSDVRSTLDHDQGVATLSATVAGEPFETRFEQSSDWVGEDFFQFVNDVFGKKFDQQWVTLPAEDQCAELILVNKACGELAVNLFARVSGFVDREEQTRYQIVSALFFSLLGLIVTFVGCWIAYGFWVSLGISLLLWVGFFLWRAIKALNEQEREAIFEKELRDNPEMIGQLAVQFVNELKK